MSTNEITQKNPNDVFSTCQENTGKLFNNVKRCVPRYHQSVTNVQQEYLQACETIVNSSILLQKEFAKKTGIDGVFTNMASKIIPNSTEEFAKAVSIQNKLALTVIDATQQNIKVFNDNTKSFVDLNKSILQSWMSIFSVHNNN